MSGTPPPGKGKIFDTRFGLIYVQTGKKNFCQGTPPPPVKGKNFDTRFGLIHVQTGKKNFCQGTPPPPVKGKNFDTRFGLIHVQTGKKNFCQGPPPPRNSKKLLWLRGGRYASCVHAGGLSCLFDFQHHRVREPDEEHLRQRTRRSVVYFFNSDENTIVESFDGSNKYPPISASEYLNQRLQIAKTESN